MRFARYCSGAGLSRWRIQLVVTSESGFSGMRDGGGGGECLYSLFTVGAEQYHHCNAMITTIIPDGLWLLASSL
jgi:hypothetical protein